MLDVRADQVALVQYPVYFADTLVILAGCRLVLGGEDIDRGFSLGLQFFLTLAGGKAIT